MKSYHQIRIFSSQWHRCQHYVFSTPETKAGAGAPSTRATTEHAEERTEEAHEALSKLYGPNYHVTEELEIIQDNLKKLRDSRGRKITYLKELNRHPEIYKPFLIIVVLSIIQQFSGMSILRAYVVKIFNDVFHRTS